MEKFWTNHLQMRKRLNNVKNIMLDNIKTREGFLDETLKDMIKEGGKMLRPSFVIMSSYFGDSENEKIDKLAAIVEMLHTATLVHDDIIDNSKFRRARETIQSRYGKDYAVYIGDFLFCRCFEMLSEGYTMENMKMLSKAISKICMSEIRQYHTISKIPKNIREYFRIIGGKTAALFAISFYIGAKEANVCEKESKTLARIGFEIGMAFQMIDDLLDFNESESTKKPKFLDIKNGYYTLPVLFALKSNYKEEIIDLINKDKKTSKDFDKLHSYLIKSNSIKKAKLLAKKYTDRAIKRAKTLPDNDSKDLIIETIKRLLQREY